MNELKLTLIKNKDSLLSISKETTNIKSNHNKSKSESMWVFDDDSEEMPQYKNKEKFNDSTKFLESRLVELFKKDNTITENAFERVVEQFQQIVGEGKNQISYLLVMQDKLTDLTENLTGQTKKFFEGFIELVEKKISEIRKKQKKNNLLEFDKIVSNNFKKKDQLYQTPISNSPSMFLNIGGTVRQRQKSGSKSRDKQSKQTKNQSRQKSSQKPLNKLLFKQKLVIKQKHSEENDNINQTHTEQTQKSTSYTAIMSASCAVKQRNRPRRNTKRKEELEIHQNNKEQEGEQDKEKAFVFYRPKKNK